MKTSCGKFLNLAHYFPYDVKLRLLGHSRSFLANQKARNAIVGAENLLIDHIRILGIGLERAMRGNIIKKRSNTFAFETTPCISLSCKLVPVQYRQYEYGLFNRLFPSSLVPLFQNESQCETIQMKMSYICMKMNL